MCHIEHMPSVNIRELRNTKQLKQWLRSGKKVELRDRSEIIGEIVPKNRRKSTAQWPDFDALAKEIIGDRILSGSDLLIEERGRD